MSKIAFRDYLTEIDTLISTGATNQAIAHLRHLVELYPKNIAVYRAMGHAFLAIEDLASAKEMFQRVLSAEPADEAAHIGLATVLEQRNDITDAIWHAERAFESEPSNNTVRRQLSALYEKRDGTAPERILLTRGALCRLYLNGDLFDQAIAESQVALGEQPERADLKLILAEAQWKSDKTEAATETCDALLKSLPNCRPAHHMLASIWQEAGVYERSRPHHLALKELDPYYEHVTDLAELDATHYVAPIKIEVEKLAIAAATTQVALPQIDEELTVAEEIANIEEQHTANAEFEAVAPTETLGDTQPMVPIDIEVLSPALDAVPAEADQAVETKDSPTETAPDTEVDTMTGNDSIFQPNDNDDEQGLPDWLNDGKPPTMDTGALSSIFGLGNDNDAEQAVTDADNALLQPDEAALENIFNLTEDDNSVSSMESTTDDDLPDWLKAINAKSAPAETPIDPLAELTQPPVSNTEPLMPDVEAAPELESLGAIQDAEAPSILESILDPITPDPEPVVEQPPAPEMTQAAVDAIVANANATEGNVEELEKGELPDWLAPFGIPSKEDGASIEPILKSKTAEETPDEDILAAIDAVADTGSAQFEVPEMPDWLPEPAETVRQTPAADSTMPTLKATSNIEDTSPDWLRKPEEDPFADAGDKPLDVPDWLHQAMQAEAGGTAATPAVDAVAATPEPTPAIPAIEESAIATTDSIAGNDDAMSDSQDMDMLDMMAVLKEGTQDISEAAKSEVAELPPIEAIAETVITPVTDELPMQVEEIVEETIAPEISMPEIDADMVFPPPVPVTAGTEEEADLPDLGALLDNAEEKVELPTLDAPIETSIPERIEDITPEIELPTLDAIVPEATAEMDLPAVADALPTLESAPVIPDVEVPSIDAEEDAELPLLSELIDSVNDAVELPTLDAVAPQQDLPLTDEPLGLDQLEAFISPEESQGDTAEVAAQILDENPSWLHDILGEPTVENPSTLSEDDINTIFQEATQAEPVDTATNANVEDTSPVSSTDELVEETEAWLDSIQPDPEPAKTDPAEDAIDLPRAENVPEWLKNLEQPQNGLTPIADNSIGDLDTSKEAALDLNTQAAKPAPVEKDPEPSGWAKVDTKPLPAEPIVAESEPELDSKPEPHGISMAPLGALGSGISMPPASKDAGLTPIDDKVEKIVEDAPSEDLPEVIVEAVVEDTVIETSAPVIETPVVETPAPTAVEPKQIPIPEPPAPSSGPNIAAIRAEMAAKRQVKVSKPKASTSINLIEHAHGLFEKGENDRAYDVFQKLVKSGKNLDTVVSHLEDIGKSDKATPLWMQLLGDAYMRNDQLQQALDAYKSALSRF